MFSFLKKRNYRTEMYEFLKAFMLEYIRENPCAADTVIPIFSNAELIIRQSSENDLKKAMKENDVSIEHGVLNIVQNCAMVEIKPQDYYSLVSSIVHREKDPVLALYDNVNNLKYKKGYINKQQFDENELLGIQRSTQSPLGNMFF